MVGEHGNTFAGSRGKAGRAMDTVNSGVTTGFTVYAKPGHTATRLGTNAVTNIMQGSAKYAKQGYSLFKDLSEEDRRRAWAAAGQHGFMSILRMRALASLALWLPKGAQMWAHRADAMFRFNSIAYEARKAGYRTPAQFKDFLDKLEDPKGLSPEEKARVENVAKKANRTNISYDRLNDTEKRVAGRALWFYPWLKGSSTYAGRTVLENPVKTFVLGHAGANESKRDENILGELPSYESGLMPVGHMNAAGNIPTTNLNTFSPAGTLGSLLQVPEYGALAQNLNPVAGALIQLLTRTNQYGQHSNTPGMDALQAILGATPEFQIGSAASGHKSKMFPTENVRSELYRFLGGPAVPRQVNKADLNKAALAGLEISGR